MATTIKQTEAVPAEYPEIVARWMMEKDPDNPVLTMENHAPDPAQLWQRIESYIAYRWTVRQCVWIVEGDGDWAPPLTPTTITTVEVWENQAWSEVMPDPSPYGGYDFPGEGPYRVTADVGGGTVPAAVVEAYRRLHEYSRGIMDSFKNSPASGGDSYSVSTWAARSLTLSGAADLLRPYRRA